MKYLTIVLMIHLVAIQNVSANDCLPYEPAKQRLRGTLERHVSVLSPVSSDRTAMTRYQTYWVLRLDESQCMRGRGEDENRPYGDVRTVQLHLALSQYERIKKLEGRSVWVRGALWQAHSQYHYTEILMSVDRLGLIHRIAQAR